MLNPLSVALIRGLALRQTSSDMLAALSPRLVAGRVVVGRRVEKGFRENVVGIFSHFDKLPKCTTLGHQ